MSLTELIVPLALLLSFLGCSCLTVILSRKIFRGLYDILKHSTVLISGREDFLPRDLTIVVTSAELQGNSVKVLPGPAGEGCPAENPINLEEEPSSWWTAGNSRRESFLDPALIRNCGQSNWSLPKDILKDFQPKDDELQSTDDNENDCNYVDFVPCRDNELTRSCSRLDGSLNVLKDLKTHYSYGDSKMERAVDEGNEKSEGIPLLDEKETQLEVNRSQSPVESFKWAESTDCHEGRTSFEEMVNQVKQETPSGGTESAAKKLDVNEESSGAEVGHLKQSGVALQGGNPLEKNPEVLSFAPEFAAELLREDEPIDHSYIEVDDVREKCKCSGDELIGFDVNVQSPTFHANYPRASPKESESDCRNPNSLKHLSKESVESLTRNRKPSSTGHVRNDLLPNTKNLLAEERGMISPIYSASPMEFPDDSSNVEEKLNHIGKVSLSDLDMEIFSQIDNTPLMSNYKMSLTDFHATTTPFEPNIRPMHEEFVESCRQTEPGAFSQDSLLNENSEAFLVNSEVKVKLAVSEVELANDFRGNVLHGLPNLKDNHDACSSKFSTTNGHKTLPKNHSEVSENIASGSYSIEPMLEGVCSSLGEIKLNDRRREEDARCIKEVDRLSAGNDTNHWKAESGSSPTGEINLCGTPPQEDTSHYAEDPGTPTRKDTDGSRVGVGPPPEFDKNQLHGESGFFSLSRVNHIGGEIELRGKKSTKEACAENRRRAEDKDLVSSGRSGASAPGTSEPRVDRARSESVDVSGKKPSGRGSELSATSADGGECQKESTRSSSPTPASLISFPDTQHKNRAWEEQNLNSIVCRLIAAELMKHHEKQQVIMKRAHSDSRSIVSPRNVVPTMQTMSKLLFPLVTCDGTHETEPDEPVKASVQCFKHNLKNDGSKEEIFNDSQITFQEHERKDHAKNNESFLGCDKQENRAEIPGVFVEKNNCEEGSACVIRPALALERKEVFPSLFPAKVRITGETAAIESKDRADSSTQTEHVYMIRAVRSCPIRRRQYSLFLHLQKLTANPTPTAPDLSKLIHRKASDNLIYEKAKGFSSPSYVPAPERFRWRYLAPRKLD